MHITKLRRVGGSVMLAVPPALLDTLGLAVDTTVGLDVKDGALVVSRPRPRYSLDELLDQCDPNGPPADEDRDFLESPPLGRELI